MESVFYVLKHQGKDCYRLAYSLSFSYLTKKLKIGFKKVYYIYFSINHGKKKETTGNSALYKPEKGKKHWNKKSTDNSENYKNFNTKKSANGYKNFKSTKKKKGNVTK